MSAGLAGPAPLGTLAAFLLFVVAQRLAELALSARNARRLLARGAREYGREHFPFLVILHTLFPIALVSEVVCLGARPGPLTFAWLALWAGAQLLRYAAVRALGERWNVRVLVLPGAELVRHGPYRWLRHPNYLAVLVESVSGPMMFGAWRTALAFLIANLIVLRVRIRCEERALTQAVRPA